MGPRACMDVLEEKINLFPLQGFEPRIVRPAADRYSHEEMPAPLQYRRLFWGISTV